MNITEWLKELTTFIIKTFCFINIVLFTFLELPSVSLFFAT
jgi:hypothetical protein